MNTLVAKAILASRAAYAGTDAEFVDAQNAPGETTWAECWVTYNTVANSPELGGVPMAELMYAGLIVAGMPGAAGKFLSDGFDVRSESFRCKAQQMVGNLRNADSTVVFTQAHCDAMLAPSRFDRPSQAQQWGIETLTVEDLVTAAEAVRIDTVTAQWASLTNEVLWPNITSVSVPTVERFRQFLGI